MTQLGITEGQFSGLCKDLDDDGNTIYGLRYDQFIAMQSAKIKQLEGVINEQHTEIETLKSQMAEVIAKLNAQ